MLKNKQKLFLHSSTWDRGLNNKPYCDKLLKAQQKKTLHNNLEYTSSLLYNPSEDIQCSDQYGALAWRRRTKEYLFADTFK